MFFLVKVVERLKRKGQLIRPNMKTFQIYYLPTSTLRDLCMRVLCCCPTYCYCVDQNTLGWAFNIFMKRLRLIPQGIQITKSTKRWPAPSIFIFSKHKLPLHAKWGHKNIHYQNTYIPWCISTFIMCVYKWWLLSFICTLRFYAFVLFMEYSII